MFVKDYFDKMGDTERLTAQSIGVSQFRDNQLSVRGLLNDAGHTSPDVESILGSAVAKLQQSAHVEDHLRELAGGLSRPDVESILGSAADKLRQGTHAQDLHRGVVGGMVPPNVEVGLDRTALEMIKQSTRAEHLLASAQYKTAHDYLLGDLERERLAYQSHVEAALGTTSAEWLDMPRRIRELTGQMQTYDVAPGMRAFLGEAMLRIEDHVAGLSHTSSAVIGLAMDSWKTVIEGRGYLNALSAPLLESAWMAASSSELLSRAGEDAGIRRAVEMSLMLNDADLRASTAIIEAIGLEHDRDVSIAEQPALYVPRFERNELRRRPELCDLELHEVVVKLKVGDLVVLSREITTIVLEVNDARLIAGERPIFKMTERVAKAIANLPWMAVVDERTFADFIDALYCLLFEAPGSGSLRYLTEHGGVFSGDECGVIFVIKRLRNHYRHDPEHGSEKDIKRKFDRLAEDLRARNFSSLPRVRADFRRLQSVLLAEACAFLRSLNGKIGESRELGG